MPALCRPYGPRAMDVQPFARRHGLPTPTPGDHPAGDHPGQLQNPLDWASVQLAVTTPARFRVTCGIASLCSALIPSPAWKQTARP